MAALPIAFRGLALLCSILGLADHALAQSPFDAALEVRREKLKPDPENPEAKREVSCFAYPHFVVKQVDLGEVGADRLSFMPHVSGKKTVCREEKEPDEDVIPADAWSGYFKGVKDDCAIFDAADGSNGGLGFAVFQVSGRKKLFDDTAENGLRSLSVRDGKLTLNYQRVFTASCSVVAEGASCSERAAKETGLASIPSSLCAEGYKSAKLEMAKGRCEAQSGKDDACIARELKILDEQKWDTAPTVVTYDVEASQAGEAMKLKPLGPVLACRPSD